jgi:type II secretory pathway pseudopilin PulG
MRKKVIGRKLNLGLSLLEILVVMSTFAILGILVTQSVVLTLRGSRKSESQVRVRENLNYALSIMERQLRNADSIDSCLPSVLSYKDSLGNVSTFSCQNYYIASGSASLTSQQDVAAWCEFTCDLTSTPPSVTISIDAQELTSQGVEGASVTATTKIFLRTY